MLFEKLKADVGAWRAAGYPCDYPLIGEILSYQRTHSDADDITADGSAATPPLPPLKFLREPQFLALEIYWYIRVVLKTPHIIDIYKHYYGDDVAKFCDALGIEMSSDALQMLEEEDKGIDYIINKVKTDKKFVRARRADTLHEAFTLDYPSYILALAMGAGKTVLIGTIIATEFAMALHHSDSPTSDGDNDDSGIRFMKNALVFAPGTTIIESLRELSDMSFEKVLPPYVYVQFEVNLKIVFADKAKDIQAQHGSYYNLVITNTEKISLRAKKRKNELEINFERANVEANLRLQKIATLPDLGIFADEAHHAYGNTFDKIKRVRETIDYIHGETRVIAVVNTTGTPYYKKKLLKEVVVWYGLKEGIVDNILKPLTAGIHQYDMKSKSDDAVFTDIIHEFFKTYGDVSLPNGAKAKIAFYFKSQEHLNASRPLIERAMAQIDENITQVLVNTQTSDVNQIDEFHRLNDPANQQRVILLISKGVEGWDCPSLFACALIKEQTSNIFVLQAACRCLRQVAGNRHPAKVFLDTTNSKILSKQLQDFLGTNLTDLQQKSARQEDVVLKIRKAETLPELEITRKVKRIVRKDQATKEVKLTKPEAVTVPATVRHILTPNFSGEQTMFLSTGEAQELPASNNSHDCYMSAWKIASRYHLPIMPILQQLKKLYPGGVISTEDLYALMLQTEKQYADYEEVEDTVADVMALIRTHDHQGKALFESENGVLVHRLRLHKNTAEQKRELDLFAELNVYDDLHDLSFHYTPYNFDSQPERSLFVQVLGSLNLKPKDVRAFLFTGGLTDPQKTDFYFEYLGEDDRYHRYFPDFVIVKNTGEFYIVEVKGENQRSNPTVVAKQEAIKNIEDLNPDKFKYHVVYTTTNDIAVGEIQPITSWIRQKEGDSHEDKQN